MDISFIDTLGAVLGLLGGYFAILLVLSLSVGIIVEPLTWYKGFREHVSPDDVLTSVQVSLPDESEETSKVIAIQTYVSQTDTNLAELEKSVQAVRDNAFNALKELGMRVNMVQSDIALKWSVLQQMHLRTEESRVIVLRVISTVIGISIAFFLNINTFEIIGPLFPPDALFNLTSPIGQLGGVLVTGLVSGAVSLYWRNLLERMQNLASITRNLSRDRYRSDVSIQDRIFSEAAEELKKVDPSDIQGVAASQTKLLKSYHDEVLNQAKKSFTWAIIAAIIGLIFFIMAVGFLAYDRSSEIAVISTISGVLIEFISGVNFYLYSRTANQMASFQQRLEIIQRYLLANSMCESLVDDYKNRTRSDLIKSLVGIKDGLFLPPENMEVKATP